MIGTLHKLSSPSCDTSCTELQALLREKFEAYDDCDWLDYSFYVSVYHGSELVGVCEFLIYIDYIFISYIYCNIKRAGVGSSMVKFIIIGVMLRRTIMLHYLCLVNWGLWLLVIVRMMIIFLN